jgi:hypothetical protein
MRDRQAASSREFVIRFCARRRSSEIGEQRMVPFKRLSAQDANTFRHRTPQVAGTKVFQAVVIAGAGVAVKAWRVAPRIDGAHLRDRRVRSTPREYSQRRAPGSLAFCPGTAKRFSIGTRKASTARRSWRWPSIPISAASRFHRCQQDPVRHRPANVPDFQVDDRHKHEARAARSMSGGRSTITEWPGSSVLVVLPRRRRFWICHDSPGHDGTAASGVLAS